MVKLYDIAKDYLGFIDSDMEGEELTECLDSIKDSFDEKAGNIVALIETFNSDINAIDDQINRLQKRKKSISNNKNRLKEYLLYNMEVSGIKKVNNPLFNISIRKGLPKVNIIDESLIPDEYFSVKTEIKPNLTELKRALKNGDIEGAEMVTGRSTLTIK